MNFRICAPRERHAGLNRNNSNMVLFVDERGFLPRGKAPTATINPLIQLHIPINQDGTYVKICFYKRKLATSILRSWIANICASITQNRRVDSVISCIVDPVRERPDP